MAKKDNDSVTVSNYKEKLDTPEKKQKYLNMIAYDVQQNGKMPLEYFVAQPLTLSIIASIFLIIFLFGSKPYELQESLLNSLPFIVIIVVVLFKLSAKRKKDTL